uniref:THUMP domain-containing protein 3 n=1 Tax=Cacopsylla melanoneura TaxID=428564 RepID=A0A8D8WKS4_9HEMI
MDIHKLVSTAQASENQITIEATVVTGFEDVVREECQEKFGKDMLICTSTGRVFFNITLTDIDKVKELRGIDNILLVVASFDNFGFTNLGTEETEAEQDTRRKSEDKVTDIAIIQTNSLLIDWKKYMDIWKQITNYKGILYPSNEQFNKYNDALRQKKNIRHEENLKDKSKAETTLLTKTELCKDELLKLRISGVDNKLPDDIGKDTKTKKSNEEENLLRFRVTCNRVGKHTTTSMEIERAFGGTLNDTHLWLVDLDDYDIDISLQVRYNEVYVGLSITEKSLHRRNIVEFNITTLKATIGYNLVRLASPSSGDIFLDPMCGGGTIPIECALSYPNVHFLSGDINEKLVVKTQGNVSHNSTKVKRNLGVSPLVCNGRHLCFKPACIDGVVTDLPFGKRVGSKSNNFLLYRLFLIEIGKVVRPKVGRAILLTSDRKHLIQALHVSSSLWNCKKQIKINMSGIKSFVFILKRTADLFDYALHGLKEKHRGKPFPPRNLSSDNNKRPE